jgi:hypothetical protein
MIDKILLQRYADVGSRRIVGCECKLEAVSLTTTEKEWALNGQSVEQQHLENASEIVLTNRGFWLVTIADGVVLVAKPPKVNDR